MKNCIIKRSIAFILMLSLTMTMWANNVYADTDIENTNNTNTDIIKPILECETSTKIFKKNDSNSIGIKINNLDNLTENITYKWYKINNDGSEQTVSDGTVDKLDNGTGQSSVGKLINCTVDTSNTGEYKYKVEVIHTILSGETNEETSVSAFAEINVIIVDKEYIKPNNIELVDVKYTVNDTDIKPLDGTTTSNNLVGDISYQWYRVKGYVEDERIEGATSDTYTPTSDLSMGVGTYKYRVEATNKVNLSLSTGAVGTTSTLESTVESNVVTVTVANYVETPKEVVLQDAEYEKDSKAVALDGTSSVSDNGILTYSWYRIEKDEDGNDVDVKIEGAADATYVPDTSLVGEYRYKVVVTNTLYKENGDIDNTATKESNIATIKVVEASSDNNKEDLKEENTNTQDKNKDNVDNKDKNNNFKDKRPDNMTGKGEQMPGKGFSKKDFAGKEMVFGGSKDRRFTGGMKGPNGFDKNKMMSQVNKQTKTSSGTSTEEEEEDTSYKEVEIEDKSIKETVDIEYGEGKVSVSVVEDGVDELADLTLESVENVLGATLTDSDLKKAYGGSTIKIKVIAKFINEDVPKADKELIKEGTKVLNAQVSGLSVGHYLDISVSKKIGDDNWKKLTDLKKRLQMVLTLPADMKQKDGEKYIIRLHDGEYVLVKDMDEDEDTFTFSTKYFSTYALAFIDSSKLEKTTSETIDKPKYTGWIIGIISTLILTGVIIVVVKRRKQSYE